MSRPQCDDLNPGNTTTVELFDVKVNGVGDLRDDAVVTVTVKNAAGGVVAGGNAVAMPNFESGGYRGVLPNTLAIVPNNLYSVEITATIAGVGIGLWTIDKVAKERGRC